MNDDFWIFTIDVISMRTSLIYKYMTKNCLKFFFFFALEADCKFDALVCIPNMYTHRRTSVHTRPLLDAIFLASAPVAA